MDTALVVLCTFPDADTAARLGTVLVEEELAACATLVPSVRSIYRWQGNLHDDAETLAIIKTTGRSYPALEARLADLHPYDCPEILAIDVTRGYPPYLQWLTR